MPKRLADVCEGNHLNPAQVLAVQQDLIDGLSATYLADAFRGLSDPSRVRIISVLREGEISVFDLASLVAMTQSAVSHQLATLRDAKLVNYRKCGRKVYYSLRDEHITSMFDAALELETA